VSERAFVKAATLRERLECEVEGLAALRTARAVRVPDVISLDDRGLALEWLDLRPHDPASGAALGAALAALHRAPAGGERFGWSRDNYIGATPQHNGWCATWREFFRERRLRPQLARAAGHGAVLPRDAERLLAGADALLAGHDPRPSLLHGDLWGGNAAALPDGTPVIFDPAVYLGDREADLAMTELFGAFPPSFYRAYREDYPLDEGYSLRRELYNLYHLLNHLDLFGAAYRSRCDASIARLLAHAR
jgi:fructosamine-3-kinase